MQHAVTHHASSFWQETDITSFANAMCAVALVTFPVGLLALSSWQHKSIISLDLPSGAVVSFQNTVDRHSMQSKRCTDLV